MRKRLLFVCLGNICRSPAAEGVFLDLLQKRRLQDKFLVDSAGTGGWHIGNPADSRMQNAAQRRGINLPSRARQIQMEDFDNFDLILTMDDENLAVVRKMALELGPKVIAEIRPILQYSKSGLKEVPDPYYGGDRGFEEVLDLLQDACEGLLDAISTKR